MADYSRPTTPENGHKESNGVSSPRTPNHTGLALTEYTANPSPPSESPKHAVIPKAFLLPNGQPDVLKPLFVHNYVCF
jgi:threonine dehydratase